MKKVKNNTKIQSILPVCILLSILIIIIVKEALIHSVDEYKYKADFFAMDTFVSVRSQNNISEDIKKIFSEYQSALDCNNDSGEAFRLNRNGRITGSEILCKSIHDVLDLNKKYGNLTDITTGRLTGLWNVTADNPVVPAENDIKSALETLGSENIIIQGNEIILENNSAVDFGSVGKGAVLDACLEYLDEKNSVKTFISSGSSLLLAYGDSFEVSIADPDGGILARVNTNAQFVSTSGGYERYFEADGKTYCHIIDPRTGYPTETDLVSVTVFCDSGIKSDFLSTMIFIDGTENINKYLNSSDYWVFAADSSNKIYVSDNLDYEVLNEKYTKK